MAKATKPGIIRVIEFGGTQKKTPSYIGWHDRRDTLNPKFAQLADRLHPAFIKLISQPAVLVSEMANNAEDGIIDAKGVYLFTEAGTHLFVGRSNRLFHWYDTQVELASKLACAEAKIRRAASKSGPGETLSFAEASDGAMVQVKARMSAMEFRCVEEEDPICQRLLEIYAAVALATRYNDFDFQ